MLTGDAEGVAKAVSAELGIDEYIAEVLNVRCLDCCERGRQLHVSAIRRAFWVSPSS
jgi:high-affinity K+ transport system ATPase subunit B